MEKVQWEVPQSKQQREAQAELIRDLQADGWLRKRFAERDWPLELLERYPNRIDQWRRQLQLCDGCRGLAHCRQGRSGELLDLSWQGSIQSEVRRCGYAKQAAQARRHLVNYRISDLPLQLQTLMLPQLQLEAESAEYTRIVAQLSRWLLEPQDQGFYLYGRPGVGKTYLAAAAANAMAKKGKTVVFLHVPSWLSRLKNWLDDPDVFEQQIYWAMHAQFAVFDDIGAENVTSWIRDEVLLPVLNHRMENQRWTWFTSNEDFESLFHRYCYNQKSEKEELKAVRLTERIQALAKLVQLSGNNRRRV